MRSAILNGVIGTTLVFWAGIQVLRLSARVLAICVLASQAAAFISLFFILRVEKVPFMRKYVITRSLKTWILFLSVYFGTLVLLAAPLRDPRNLIWLAAPLMLTTGFSIILFGPIQDRLVAREQRRAASRANATGRS